jgi:hypothetical protein
VSFSDPARNLSLYNSVIALVMETRKELTMLKSRVLILATMLAILIAACAPQVPLPVVTDVPVIPVTGVAVVQSIEIEILNTQPLQANAILRGQLPDNGCTTISSVEQVRDGNVFRISLVTTTDLVALCAQSLTPFEQVVPLDVSNLPAAQYVVNASGIEKSFELLPRDAFQFQQVLVEALNARNYDLLKVLMDDSLMIGYWLSEGTTNTPEAAIEQLRLNLLNSASPIVAEPRKNLIELLGSDPRTIVGPEVVDPNPLYTAGWGSEGKDEAILFVAKLPDGSLYWYGMLFAKDGFKPVVSNPVPTPTVNPPSNPPAPDVEIVPTISILEVVKNEYVTIRTFDYPANVNFKVRMGFMGTRGIDGFVVDTVNSRNGGSLTLTLEIPERLHGEKQIAIRLESEEGYYSYSWFDNTSSWSAPVTTDPLPTGVKYVMAQQDISIYSGPSKNYSIIGMIAEGQVAKVTGVSLDGNWWRVICPNGSIGSCWVIAKPKFTEPTSEDLSRHD